jgi:hypothetical protein
MIQFIAVEQQAPPTDGRPKRGNLTVIQIKENSQCGSILCARLLC